MPRTTVGGTGTAISFNGTSSKVSVTSVAAQNDLTAITVSFWINATNYTSGGGFPRLFHKGPNAVGYIDISANTTQLILNRDYATQDEQATWPVPSTGTWHHILITDTALTEVASSDFKFYLNNVVQTQATSQSGTGGRAADSSALAIGNRTTDTARGFAGLIDEVRLYNRVLTAVERAVLLTKGDVQGGLVGYWPFDDISGNKVFDFSSSVSGGTVAAGTIAEGTVPIKRHYPPTARTVAGARTIAN